MYAERQGVLRHQAHGEGGMFLNRQATEPKRYRHRPERPRPRRDRGAHNFRRFIGLRLRVGSVVR